MAGMPKAGKFMAFCELALKANDSGLHPGMNERSRWFDHDLNLIVVAIAKPIERHGTSISGMLSL